jgi:hypothetical protein
MSHEETMAQFLKELELFCEAYCEEKAKRRLFLLRKICQKMFSSAEKTVLKSIIDNEFGTDDPTATKPDELGSKKLYNVLEFIFEGTNPKNGPQ